MPDRAGKVWAGRLGAATSPAVEAYTSSVDVDARLLPDDVAGSLAHAAMLHQVGVLSDSDHDAIAGGLRSIADETARGEFAFVDGDEDVHTAVERRLIELVGAAGGALHAGRSRNDQVATDLRLFARRACTDLVLAVTDLQAALLRRAAEHRDTLMPGYTHLQRAQPVSLGHHLLAYVSMLQRDADRLHDARERCDVLSLGSGALAGSTLPLDRDDVARRLGFAAVAENSIDAVSDRDFAVELTAACALVMVHCSRLGEEIVLWASTEFGYAFLPDTHATGSSIMPQKKNPDVAELARGRCGRVTGALVSLLMTLKGLPLAYNRDLQEDKGALFDAVDVTAATLTTLAELVDVIRFDAERLRAAAADPALLATDVAEYLVQRGVRFRDAHRVVAELVRRSAAEGRSIADVTIDEWQSAAPAVDAGIAGVLDVDGALARRPAPGGPGPGSVNEQIRRARERIDEARRSAGARIVDE